MSKIIIFMVGVLIVYPMLINVSMAWFDSDWLRRDTVTVENNQPYARTNATWSVNINDYDYAEEDCSDMVVTDSSDLAIFPNFSISPTGATCNIYVFDNFRASETKTYYIYYDNDGYNYSENYLDSKYEIAWKWNGTQQDITDNIYEIFDDVTRNLTAKTCEGTPCIAVYRSGIGTTAWNLTHIDIINGSDWGLKQNIHFVTKYNGSENTGYTLIAPILRVKPNDDDHYELFTYSSDAGGGCSYGFYLRNRSSTTYNTPVNCTEERIAKNKWYIIDFNIDNSNSTIGTHANSTDTYELRYTWGTGTFNYKGMGLRTYEGGSYTEEESYIKELEAGYDIANRNVTVTDTLSGETTSTTTMPVTTTTTEPLTTTETTTTLPLTTTTETTTSTVDLGNAERIAWFCSPNSQYLVKNTTTWNTTSASWLTVYNMTYCEYNCTETIIGTRCNYSKSINGGIGMLILISLIAGVYVSKRLIGGLT